MFKQFDADNIDDLKKSMPDFSKYKKIDIIGCGSAYHAGLLGKSLIVMQKNDNLPFIFYIYLIMGGTCTLWIFYKLFVSRIRNRRR